MSRLFLLNVLLLAGIAFATMRLLELREETERREQMVHNSAPQLPKAKATSSVPTPERTVAANYLDIAARLLFSKDRNPTVIIAPPPVKKVPDFPVAYGVLMMADPPIIMMSAKKGAPQKGYRPGDIVGDFKIAGFNASSITFEWDGQKFTKNVRDLADRDALAASAQQNRQNVPAETAAVPASAATVKSLAESPGQSKGPGVDTGGGIRACAPGDSSPAGAISDGYRKVVSETPFGKVCRWEQVK